MKVKTVVKITVDAAMTVLLIALMAYQITGNYLHEWLGMFLYLLFFLHIFLNRQWWKVVSKGNYTSVRFIHTILNFMLLGAMVGLVISSIMISRNALAFLGMGTEGYGRRLHLLSAVWGFLFMSIHLGLHWGMMVGALKKRLSKARMALLIKAGRIVASCFSSYGLCAFLFYQIGQKLFSVGGYPLFEFHGMAVLLLMDYISILILLVCVTHYGSKWLKTRMAHNDDL